MSRLGGKGILQRAEANTAGVLVDCDGHVGREVFTWKDGSSSGNREETSKSCNDLG